MVIGLKKLLCVRHRYVSITCSDISNSNAVLFSVERLDRWECCQWVLNIYNKPRPPDVSQLT